MSVCVCVRVCWYHDVKISTEHWPASAAPTSEWQGGVWNILSSSEDV